MSSPSNIITIMPQVVEGKVKLMDNLSNYIIVDIGANLTNKKFSRDLDQVIQRATDSGEETFPSGCQMIRRSASINHASRWSSLIIPIPLTQASPRSWWPAPLCTRQRRLCASPGSTQMFSTPLQVSKPWAFSITVSHHQHHLFPFVILSPTRPNWLFPDFGQIADHRADYLLP